MQRLFLGSLCLALASMFVINGSARAQDAPTAEVFGGYSFVNIDTNGLTSRQNANGWEASVSGNVYRRLAVEGDFSGYYKNYAFDLSDFGLNTVNVDVKDYAFLGGPRVNFRPVFVHALVGVDHLSGSALGFSASQNSFAGAFGGGVEVPVAPRWAIRLSADYILTHHNIFGGPGTSYAQNNFRASAGIVFTFGGTREGRLGGRSPEPRTPGGEEAALLGVTVYRREGGVVVAAVRDSSPAAAAGIEVGDVIITVDDQEIRSGHDIETIIATSKTGTVRIMYFKSGVLQSFKDVTIR